MSTNIERTAIEGARAEWDWEFAQGGGGVPGSPERAAYTAKGNLLNRLEHRVAVLSAEQQTVDEHMAGDKVFTALRMVAAIEADQGPIEYGLGRPIHIEFTWHGHTYRLTLESVTT